MNKKASLYRMSTQQHICPYGLKSRHLLKKQGFNIEDHLLENQDQVNSFKEQHQVDTTPQTFIDGKRIGGYDELKAYFGTPSKPEDTPSYLPVAVVFGMALLMATALCWSRFQTFHPLYISETFIALAMCVLAIQKLRDLSAFSLLFISYDLLAMRYVPYAYIYAFIEGAAGLGVLVSAPGWLIAPPVLFIGAVGTISVVKAVYIDKRNLKCACVGGNSNVPLGVVSLTENIMMVVMGCWMFMR